MEKDFDSKLRIQNGNSSSSSASSSSSSTSSPLSSNNNNNNNGNMERSKSFACRDPQENFSIQDFELGKMYGVGSYSKAYVQRKLIKEKRLALVEVGREDRGKYQSRLAVKHEA